jgi:hypothetical protein
LNNVEMVLGDFVAYRLKFQPDSLLSKPALSVLNNVFNANNETVILATNCATGSLVET